MKSWLLVIGICALFLLTSLASGNVTKTTTQSTPTLVTTNYTGKLRVFIAEPLSRWNMHDGNPYHFGCLGIPTQTDISIPYHTWYDQNFTWTGSFSDNNIMVMAAVYNSEGHTAYSYPPSSYPFTAHYVDAMAAANPGATGYNQAQTGFTHTVFAEEATATWCPQCPSMAGYFYQVYESHTYPFYFISLVGDMNSQAYSHLVSDYNLYNYPTGYFDGGYKVLYGPQYNVTPTVTNIISSGALAVADLNFSVSCTIISSGTQLKYRVRIYSNYVSQFPETPAAPDGPTSGLVGYPYQFSAITTDPQNDPMYYWFDWGDGTNSGWVGPFSAGVAGTASHSWTYTGNYAVKVKAKDPAGHETAFSSTTTIVITGISTRNLDDRGKGYDQRHNPEPRRHRLHQPRLAHRHQGRHLPPHQHQQQRLHRPAARRRHDPYPVRQRLRPRQGHHLSRGRRLDREQERIRLRANPQTHVNRPLELACAARRDAPPFSLFSFLSDPSRGQINY